MKKNNFEGKNKDYNQKINLNSYINNPTKINKQFLFITF